MRVIPIAPSMHGEARPECRSDEEGRIPRLELPLARREFLEGSGVLIGTIASGSVLAALAPSPVWALELKRLSTAEGKTVMAMGRTLYPHEKLPDAVYALLAKDLDAKADEPLHEGLRALDRAAGGSFVDAPAARRLQVVRAIEGTPFFATVRGQCITSLYDNDMAYAVFGYPGASFDKGGYITRGFQDLKWLPAPDRAASPPVFLG